MGVTAGQRRKIIEAMARLALKVEIGNGKKAHTPTHKAQAGSSNHFFTRVKCAFSESAPASVRVLGSQ
jgi:GTP cyclohydrolase III